MKTTKDGRRRFSREYKLAATRRVQRGEKRPAFKIAPAVFCLALGGGTHLPEILLPRSIVQPFWGLDQGSSKNKQAIAASEVAFGREIDTETEWNCSPNCVSNKSMPFRL
jgi:hypothetical protein